MDRVEIFAPGAKGEDEFWEMSSNSQVEKKCLDFRGSVQEVEMNLWARTLRRWRPYILNHFVRGMTNGYTGKFTRK